MSQQGSPASKSNLGLQY